MACSGLDAASGGGDEPLDGGCVETPCEFLLLRFLAFDDGDGEEVFIDPTVEVEDMSDLDLGVSLGEMCCVPLLPEELASADERFCNTETKINRAFCRLSKNNNVRGFLNSHRTTLFH